jgi:hypothetical protein
LATPHTEENGEGRKLARSVHTVQV